ncbi:hypothetical protein ACH5RR_039371 [Cinchona calisaya]|uniref:Zinc finger PMZ-type domain-containing protein n=1 Tax=Cinchona calisaya TaxID=153742 RepID=A0ABD2XYJ8_9GENT
MEEYANDSDELKSYPSGEEESQKKHDHFPRFKASTNVDAPQFKVKMVFSTAEEFKMASSKRGFLDGYRNVLGLDGCHLRGPHKGGLLADVCIDPNNQLYPIAYAIVDIENKVTWTWFLCELIGDLQIKNQSKWTLIIDKQKGLIQAVNDLLPNVEHMICVRHMYNNFIKVYCGLALKDKIWAVARASTVNRMEKKKKEWMKKYNGKVCPKVLKKFEKIKDDAKACIPIHAGDWKYEIRTCSCRKWDLNGIPCSRAVSAIADTSEDLESFIHDCYSKEAYMRACGPIVNPLNGTATLEAVETAYFGEWGENDDTLNMVPDQLLFDMVDDVEHTHMTGQHRVASSSVGVDDSRVNVMRDRRPKASRGARDTSGGTK